MMKRLVLMSLLCQVYTFMIADYTLDAAAELDDDAVVLARAGREADPENETCACARASSPMDLTEKWGKKKLDKLLKWITSFIGSLKEEEMEGPVVVLPVLIDGSFMKAVVQEVQQEVPEDRGIVVDEEEEATTTVTITEDTVTTTEDTVTTTEDTVTITETTVTTTQTTVAPTDTTLSTSPAPKDPQEVCNQPREKGVCRAIQRRWYYNSTTSDCTMFIYGGCGGNDNRFPTKDECMTFCVGVGPAVITT